MPVWISFILKRPLFVLCISLVCVVGAGFGASNLYFRGDYKVFFKPDNPQRVAYERMQEAFTKNESVSIVIAAREGNLFNAKSLGVIKSITDESWQVPLSSRVDSITNFQRTYSLEEDLVVEDLLLDVDWLDAQHIQVMKTVSLNEPDLVNKLISSDGSTAMININVLLPDGDQTKEIGEISAFVREMIAPYISANPELRFELSGIVVMTDAMFIAAKKDALTLFPFMFILICVLIAVLLRSAWATVASLAIVSLSVVGTLGVGGWLGMFINIATVNVPVIIMTIAIADSIHVVTGMRYYMEQGDSKREAISKSVVLNLNPIIMTSVTTAIGFLTLNFAEVPIFVDLGNLLAVGVIFACVLSLVLLPALLLILPVHFQKRQSKDNRKAWDVFGDFTLRYSTPIIFIGVFMSIAAAFLAQKNELNDIAINYFNKSNEFRQAADFQQDNLSGLSTIDFAVYTGRDNAINEIEYLETIEEFTKWLESQSEVDHVLSYTNTLKRLSMNFNEDNSEFYALPNDNNLSAQYLLLYEMSLPYGLDINNQIDIGKSAVRVMVTLKNLGSKDFTGFEDRAKAWMASNGPDYQIDAASLPLIFAHIGKANMQGMIQGTLLALILISCLLMLALKSVRLGLISLVPNLMPALSGFAIWAIISAEISMALSVVLTMTLGIIVDDTVHFLSKYKKAIVEGRSNQDAIIFAFNNVGNALMITTIVLASGFGVLALSDFAINSDMGTLTSIIILLALIVDLSLLPALLNKFGMRKTK